MAMKLKVGYSSPRWSGEVADCSMPMTFDQYGKCSYRCFYCFSNFQKTVGVAKANFAKADQVTCVNIERVRRIFTGEGDVSRGMSQFRVYIAERRPFQWGGLADPFCEHERQFGIGLQLLRFFKELDYPICFSTKGAWWTGDRRYIELFRGQKNWNVKVSIITPDEERVKIAEPLVPSVADRLEAIRRIARWGCGGVTLRLRPFIIGLSNPGHKELIARAADAGATALSTEFLCLEHRCMALRGRLHRINQMLGYNLMAFYQKYSPTHGYMRLNKEVKRRFVDEMEEVCSRKGIRFYVSDAHFKERCANGSCCGLPTTWNYCRGQWTEAIQIAKRRGRVFWRDMEPHMEYAKGFLYRQAENLNTQGSEHRSRFYDFTLAEYQRWVWNHPNAGQSPYKMYGGILKPSGLDKDQNVIYEYDKTQE